MAREILSVPEDYLLETIEVLRRGLEATMASPTVSDRTRKALTKWCNDEEAYITGADDADDG